MHSGPVSNICTRLFWVGEGWKPSNSREGLQSGAPAADDSLLDLVDSEVEREGAFAKQKRSIDFIQLQKSLVQPWKSAG